MLSELNAAANSTPGTPDFPISKFHICGGVDVVCGEVVFLKVESQMSPSAFCTASVKFIEPTQGAPIMIEVYDLF